MKEYESGLYEKAIRNSLSWKEKLLCAKECGYDYLELCVDASDERIARIYMSREERFELLELMYETKLPIRSMSVSALTKYALGDPDNDIYYGESTIQTKQFFLENIKKAAEITEKEGVLIGFETMENDFMNTVGKAMKYVRLVDSSYLKVYPDAGNITNAGVKLQQDVCEDMLLGKGNMIALHLKETRPGVFREVPFLTGHVDFEAIIHMAWNMGIRRYVTELWDVGQDDWKEAICFANQSMRCILDKQSEMEDRKII